MLVTHITEINGKITEPHDSACFGPVALALFCILDKNVDDNQTAKTGEVYVCENGFKYEGDVTERKDEAGHVICVNDGEVDVPDFLVPFLQLN